MDHESIEQEIKAENLRQGEREEAAAVRRHELDMAKVNRKILHVSVPVFATTVGISVGVSIFFAGLIGSTQATSRATIEHRADLKYQTLQSHAAGVQAGLSQGRNECRPVPGKPSGED